MNIPPGISLEQFLVQELGGSTLRLSAISEGDFSIESDSVVRMRIVMNDEKRELTFSLYSPRWSRKINVEELDGFTFMETHAENELFKEQAESIAEDTLLALDLVRSWAKANDYAVKEIDPSLEEINRNDSSAKT